MERSPVVQNYVEIQKREGARNRKQKSVPDYSLESLCERHSYNLPVFLPEGRQLEWMAAPGDQLTGGKFSMPGCCNRLGQKRKKKKKRKKIAQRKAHVQTHKL